MKFVFTLFFLIILGVNYAQGQEACIGINLHQDLIAHFPLNNNAVEELGSGFDGTIIGASPAPDRNGNPNSAYLFDGNDDQIHIGDHFDLGKSSFTISCWVNVFEFKDLIEGTDSRGGWIINKGGTIFGTPRRAGYALDARTLNGKNYFYFFVGDQNDKLYNANNSGFKKNVWYSLIGIKDKDSISLYVDNRLVATTIIPSGINVDTNIPLVIGSIDKLGNDIKGTTYFNGKIDDVRIYNRVLSMDERNCLVNGCTQPIVDLGEDLIICEEKRTLLKADFPHANYLWNNGSSTPTLEVSQSGTYWVEVENSCGTVRDSIRVEFNAIPEIDLGEDRSQCNMNSLQLDVKVSDGMHRWQDGSSTPTLEVSQSGTYWVEVENSCGTVRDSIIVEFNNLPEIDLGEDRFICNMNSIRLDATVSDGIYRWQDGSENPTLEVGQSGTYWVEVENSCGVERDTVKLVFPEFDDIKIPNVFTPNGDGVNDFFQIDNKLLGSSIKVFNRWGEIIYHCENYQNNWNGNNLSVGVYYWLITNLCGTQYKGNVTILK